MLDSIKHMAMVIQTRCLCLVRCIGFPFNSALSLNCLVLHIKHSQQAFLTNFNDYSRLTFRHAVFDLRVWIFFLNLSIGFLGLLYIRCCCHYKIEKTTNKFEHFFSYFDKCLKAPHWLSNILLHHCALHGDWLNDVHCVDGVSLVTSMSVWHCAS